MVRSSAASAIGNDLGSIRLDNLLLPLQRLAVIEGTVGASDRTMAAGKMDFGNATFG